MKVLMFGWEFPPHNSGGLGVACRGLARALARERVDITFVLPQMIPVGDDHMRFRFANGSTFTVKPVQSLLSAYLSPEEYEERFRETGYAPDLFGEVMRYAHAASHIASTEEFDVIHAHDWLAFPAGIAAKRASGKPVVLHVHLPAFDQSGGNGADPRVVEVERNAMQAADTIIAISYRVRDVLVTDYGIDEQKIEVIHNGIDPDDIPETTHGATAFKQSDEHMALFLGRLTLHKGPDKFIEAARIVSDVDPKAKFVVAGSGDMERQLIEQTAKSGLGSKVLFPGFVRDKEKNALFRAADVFVMPSVREPFGLVALESLAGGTPAIISKQSGVAEVVKNALKIDFWDVEELANKMLAVFRYTPLKQHLSYEGRQEARATSWKNAAEKCVGVYNNCVAISS